MAKKKRKMPAGLKKYLNSLHKKGRKAVKKSDANVKPFYFSGKKKRKSRKRKSVSHKRISPVNEPVIFTQKKRSGTSMAKRRKTHKRKSSHKARKVVHVYHGKKSRKHTRRARRYGFSMGGLKPVAILTEVAGLGAGAIGGSFLAKVIPVANTKIKALAPILLGVILERTKLGRSGIGKDIATGMITIGTLSLAKQFIPQIPVFAGVESAQELLTTISNMPEEERALLGFSGATELNGEVLTGMEDAELSPANVQ